MDHAKEEASQHRDMAEKMRARGNLIVDPEVRAKYLRIAKYYERSAESEELIAREAVSRIEQQVENGEGEQRRPDAPRYRCPVEPPHDLQSECSNGELGAEFPFDLDRERSVRG